MTLFHDLFFFFSLNVVVELACDDGTSALLLAPLLGSVMTGGRQPMTHQLESTCRATAPQRLLTRSQTHRRSLV